MERLSGDYIRGYTKAIQDTIEVFEYIQQDLKRHHKNLNGKISIMLLEAILKHREEIRERKAIASWDCKKEGFMRWNKLKNDFEWFSRKENQI